MSRVMRPFVGFYLKYCRDAVTRMFRAKCRQMNRKLLGSGDDFPMTQSECSAPLITPSGNVRLIVRPCQAFGQFPSQHNSRCKAVSRLSQPSTLSVGSLLLSAGAAKCAKLIWRASPSP